MSDNAFGSQFTDFIEKMFPEAKKASGGREIRIRCRYCGDSKDPTHSHMYIHVPMDKTDVPTFHCFLCQISGLVSSKTLIEWGIYEPLFANELDKNNKIASKYSKFKGYENIHYPFFNGVSNMDLALKKIDYIKSRIGVELTLEECMKQKIVLNLKEVLDYYPNGVTQYTRHPNIIQQLNDNFVGFMSLDNNFVNLRRIVDKGIVYEGIDKRYINYNVHGKVDNTEKMYIMLYTGDLTIPERIQIHIAEGPFDILSIRYNLRRNENGIFGAVTGSGYLGLLIHLICVYKLFYFDVHIYPDNDDHGSDYIMNKIRRYILPYGAKLFIHRNMYEGEKDFGVTPDRIIENIEIR